MFLRDNSAGMAKSGLELENPGAKRCNDVNMEMTGIRKFLSGGFEPGGAGDGRMLGSRYKK